MRGRASGFGARISSMVLLIALAHRPDHAIDERDLVLVDAVLFVEQLVGPSPVPRLLWNPRVGRTQCVLRYLSQGTRNLNNRVEI